MHQENREESGPERQNSVTKPQKIWEKYDSEPMSFLMRNPRLTPTILLILAIAPVLIVVCVLAVIFFVPEFSSQF
jgi:hypothetical protein